MVVAPVSRRAGARGDPRPSWARLPAGRGQVAAARRRVVKLMPTGSLRGARASFLRYLDRLRGTPRGRQQLTATLVVIGLLLLVGGWWLGFGRYTESPSLLQLTRANAAAEASRLGFSVDYGAGRFAEDIPIDTVLGQQPPVGARIVRGATITLFLSLGPERYAVPEVAGQASDVATARLKEQRFVVQTVNGFSDTLPVNYVVGTDPAAGTLLKPNSIVKMIVAKGSYPVHVPTLVGTRLAEAESQLRSMGFDVEVQRRDDESKPRDQVLDQDPAGGTGMAKATGKVVLVVANGPPGPPLPGVQGANCRQAIDHLRGLGLNAEVDGNDFERFFGTVKAQRPNPGEVVQPGQTVNLECRL
jgi:serine/threonine-protein kinase